METLGKFVMALVLGTASALVEAVVLRSMWGWFIVPLGVVPIGYMHALGISLIAAAMTMKLPTRAEREERDEDSWWIRPVAIAIGMLINWGVAAIVHHFMVS